MNYKKDPVCVIGMGFVGLTLAAKLSQTRKVYGLEKNVQVVETLKLGKPHFFEAGLDELVLNSVQNQGLVPISTISDLPNEVNIFVITVGTPILAKSIDLEGIREVVKIIGQRANSETLVIVRSTVKVGISRSIVLEGLRTDLFTPLVSMCPERTMEGFALEELSALPQIVSGSTNRSVDAAKEFFEDLGCPIRVVSSLETAELIKLSNNTYRDLQFAFANEIAIMSSQMRIDGNEVIENANYGYERSKIAKPGLTGGPCLEKDPWIFMESAKEHGVHARLAEASRLTHESVIPSVIPSIFSFLGKHGLLKPQMEFGIIGLAFKGEPPTDDVRGSLAIQLIESLKTNFPDCTVTGMDQFVNSNDAKKIGVDKFVEFEFELSEMDVVFIQNNNKSAAVLLKETIKQSPNWKGIVYDFWGVFEPDPDFKGHYFKLGSPVRSSM